MDGGVASRRGRDAAPVFHSYAVAAAQCFVFRCLLVLDNCMRMSVACFALRMCLVVLNTPSEKNGSCHGCCLSALLRFTVLLCTVQVDQFALMFSMLPNASPGLENKRCAVGFARCLRSPLSSLQRNVRSLLHCAICASSLHFHDKVFHCSKFVVLMRRACLIESTESARTAAEL